MAKRRHAASNDEEVDWGTDSPEEYTLSTLEEKYKDQMRQIFPSKIDLPWFGLKMQIEAQIDLRPDFQRRNRWNDEKRSRFIESVIMNVPIPPVFLGEEEYGKYVVLDGRQRLTAAYNFLNNDLRLKKLHIWKELNGLTFAEIKEKGFAAAIERRFLPAILLTRESSPEVKYEVFDRLNTGGVIADPMEVRNAIFRGSFNKLLHEASSDPGFRRLWGIPSERAALEKNALYRKMTDLELVLRFFALREGTLNGLRFKDHLSDYMKIRNAAYDKDEALQAADAAQFQQVVANCLEVFGDEAFRKPGKDGIPTGQRSAPYADAVMQALADWPTQTFTDTVKHRVRAAFSGLCLDSQEFRDAVSTGTNGASAIRSRIRLAKQAVESAVAGGPAQRLKRGGPAARSKN